MKRLKTVIIHLEWGGCKSNAAKLKVHLNAEQFSYFSCTQLFPKLGANRTNVSHHGLMKNDGLNVSGTHQNSSSAPCFPSLLNVCKAVSLKSTIFNTVLFFPASPDEWWHLIATCWSVSVHHIYRDILTQEFDPGSFFLWQTVQLKHITGRLSPHKWLATRCLNNGAMK